MEGLMVGFWAGSRLLRNVLDGEQARRFDAFSTAVIPKQAMTKVSLPWAQHNSLLALSWMVASASPMVVRDPLDFEHEFDSTQEPRYTLRMIRTALLTPYRFGLARILPTISIPHSHRAVEHLST